MTAASGKALAVGPPRCDYGGIYLNTGRAYILDYTCIAGTHGWYQAAAFWIACWLVSSPPSFLALLLLPSIRIAAGA